MIESSTYRPFGTFRTVLAFMVLAQHVRDVAPDSWRFPMPVGTTAVLAFFALSGFVITEAAERFYGGRPVEFAINRALRIVPQFLWALGLSVLAHLLAMAVAPELFEGRLIRANAEDAFAISNLLLNLVDYLPKVPVLYSFIPYAWALEVEVAFYVVLAGGLFVASKAGPLSGRWTVGLVAASAFAGFVVHPSSDLLKYTPLFVFGAAVYWAVRRGGFASWLLVVLAFVASIWVQFDFVMLESPATSSHRYQIGYSLLLAAMLVTTLLLARLKVGGRAAVLDRRIGDLSYPLYLQQFAVIVVISSFVPKSAGAVVLSVLGALALAYLSDRALERPLVKLRDFFRGRPVSQSLLGTSLQKEAA